LDDNGRLQDVFENYHHSGTSITEDTSHTEYSNSTHVCESEIATSNPKKAPWRSKRYNSTIRRRQLKKKRRDDPKLG